ncbi:MAG TPA: hypothetical protein VEA19_07250, partial [Actinomycetota bacterium]|nr:hypothetical protein [Actinomycetota bacterium]
NGRLTNGSGFIDAVSNDQANDAAALADAYVSELLQPAATQLQASSAEPVAVNVGLPAARLSYVGLFTEQSQSVEGEVTAVLLPDGTGVVFDAWATEGLLSSMRDAMRQMIGAMQVG